MSDGTFLLCVDCPPVGSSDGRCHNCPRVGPRLPPALPVEPPLLRVPEHFRNVEDVLAVAGRLGLRNIVVLSEREDGTLVFLSSPEDLTMASANWLLDRMKALLLAPHQPMRP